MMRERAAMHRSKPERRCHERITVDRPCKVYHRTLRKYFAGSTTDLSDGGVLLTLHTPVYVQPGERLYMGIALKRRQPLLHAEEMRPVEVLRSAITPDGRRAIAVRFIDEPGQDETSGEPSMPDRRAA